ncbi:MAG: MFS transporter [Rhodospirillaceae bacterium]|nr:MFS transporter [Rhodospirillaceae bacterium]MBT5777789.1 MFS transporter [Rhodospirillaceae bacterium]
MPRASRRRNVLLLALCQAFFMTSTSAIVTSAALIGYQLSADKALATLPLAMQFIAVMAVTVPASFLMKRIGRRDGFTIGLFIGLVGAGLAIVAIREADFILFCIACFFVGAFNGFGQYYRFAAADTAEDAFKSRAISLVMAGGVIASVGPLLANYSKDLLPGDVFAGVYLMIAILYIASLVTLRFVNIPRPSEEERQSGGRPLHRILRQPIFIVAALGGMVGYMLMSLLMASTPLAMHSAGHGFFDTAQVIQWHVFAMFAPAFFTGHLIRRFGTPAIMSAGAVLIVVCVAINLGGLNLTHFWIGGMALGVGWCFLFVGATTLVTECYSPAEKAKTQAANDFLVFASVACAALLSGVLHEMVGWQAMNYIALPFAAVVLIALFVMLRMRRRSPGLAE